MTEVLRIAATVMTVATGLWAGVIFFYAVERVNLWRRMSIDQFVTDFRRSVYRADPLQPILGAIGLIAAVTFALQGGSLVATALAWAGAAQILLVIALSIALPERINSEFRRRAEGEAPPEVERLRDRWRVLHFIRTVPSLGAFLVLVLSVTFV